VDVKGCLGFSQTTRSGSGSRSSGNVRCSGDGGGSTFRFSLGLDWTVGDGVTEFGAAEAEVVVKAALVLFWFQLAVGSQHICNRVRFSTRRRSIRRQGWFLLVLVLRVCIVVLVVTRLRA